MYPIETVDHKAQSEELMLSQFENSPDLQALLKSWLSPIQDMEDDLIAFMQGNGISTAVGEMLDIIGSWMGVERQGRLDIEYRTAILGRVVIQEMDGTTERFYEGFRTLINSDLAHCFTYAPNDLYAVAGEGYSPALKRELKNIAQAGTNVHLMVCNQLDYVTPALRLGEDDALVTDSEDPYEVLIGGTTYPLTTTYTTSAGAFGTESTFGWGGLTLPSQAGMVFEVVGYRTVEGLIIDEQGNYIVDESGNNMTHINYEEL